MPDSIVNIAIDGWRLAYRFLFAMPMLSGTALSTILSFRIGAEYVWPSAVGRLSAGLPQPPPPIRLMMTIITLAIMASILIAVHRFVILGELVDRPVWHVPPTYRRFVGWLVLLSLPWLGPLAAAVLFGPLLPVPSVILSLLSLAFAAVLAVRLMLLFPALAVAIPSADWRRAWTDSRDHAWKFLGAQMAACMPLILASTIVYLWLSKIPSAGEIMLLFCAAEESASQLLMICLSAAVASRLFQNYGAALAR